MMEHRAPAMVRAGNKGSNGMRKVFGTWIGIVGLMVGATLPGQARAQPAAPAPAAQPANDPGAPALAQRLSEFGRAALRTSNVSVANFRLAAAMMEAANKLDPREPRYPRLWADAALQASDAASALRALKAYTALAPDDKSALIQLADLYTRSFETADAKLGYLQGVVEVKALPEEVRSHLSFLMYQVYAERAQAPQARAALDQALALNPLSLEALRARYDRQAADGTPAERFTTLLAILKSNPTQLDALTAVSQQLAGAGLAAESLPFYAAGIKTVQRQGGQLSPALVLEYAMELTIVPQTQVSGAQQLAKQYVDAILTADPQNYEAMLLRLMAQRQAGQKEEATKTTQQALNALNNRLALIRQAIGDKSATTRPVDSADPVAWGSFDQDLARLKDLKPSEKLDPARVRDDYAGTLAEISWFEIYFNAKPAEAAPLIDALRKVEPENSPTSTRLEGWSFLARGDKDQAKVKLSAAKDRDALAGLGLVVMAADKSEQQKQGNAFLAAHPNGLLALEAMDALHDANVALTPDPARAGPLQEAVKPFPMNWLNIIDQPQTFYSLRADPVRVAHPYGEPMMVRVSIQNLGDQPITIGADGVLRPDVWLDAQIRGALPPGVPSDFPAVAVERVAKEVVLKPKQTVSQTVRLDQGNLGLLLEGNLAPSIQVTFDARTNPTASGFGPAGLLAPGARVLERSSFPLAPEGIMRLGTVLQQGAPAEKIRNIDLAYQLIVILNQQQGNADAAKTMQQLGEAVRAAARDPNPSVQAWANAIVSRFTAPQDRLAFIRGLANDPNWVTRVIGLVSMAQIPLDQQRTLLKQAIEHDTNPIVVEVAKDVTQIIDQLAAATAATQPSTAPAAGPATAPSPLTPGGGGGGGAKLPVSGTRPATSAPTVTIPSDLPFSAPPPQQPPGK